MKKSTLTLTALALTIGITGCGSAAASQTPSDVLADYVSALNDGDVEAALALTTNPAGIAPEDVHVFDAEFAEPLLADDKELTDDMSAITLEHRFATETQPQLVDFVKGDDGWKMEEPLFIREVDEERSALFYGVVDGGLTATTDDGTEVFTDGQRYAAHPSGYETDLVVDVEESDLYEPHTIMFTYQSGSGVGYHFRGIRDIDYVLKDNVAKDLETQIVNEWTTEIGTERSRATSAHSCGEPRDVGEHSGALAAALASTENPVPVYVQCRVNAQWIATEAYTQAGSDGRHSYAPGDLVYEQEDRITVKHTPGEGFDVNYAK